MAVAHTEWVGQVGERGGLMLTPPLMLPLGMPIKKNGKHAVHAHFPFLFLSPPSLGRKELSLEERGSNPILGKGKNNNILFYFCEGYVTKIKMCNATL